MAVLLQNSSGKLQSMDGSEHDRRPSKKIRLEDACDSGIIPSSSSQLDSDRVYNRSPPKLKLTEARSISPLTTACETRHHLTVDYQFTQYTAFDYQSAITYRGCIGSAPATSSATAGTTFDCNDELSYTEPPDQVCFGMVSLLTMKGHHCDILAKDH